MAERLLLGNAVEAWLLCRKYFDQIIFGNPSFQMRKMFVSTLHNVVELPLKQIMLDKNMHAVRDLRKLQNGVWDPSEMKEYLNETNLNQYFSLHCGVIHTIEFTTMVNSLSKILDASMAGKGVDFAKWCKDLGKKLKKLNDTRNAQTHFYINADDFLPWDDFCDFCEVMAQIDKIAHRLWRIPFHNQVYYQYLC